jgi:AmpE protein
MNFLALLLGLAIERLLTHLLHLREFRWLDPLFDFFLARFATAGLGKTMAMAFGLLLALVAPVALVFFSLQDRLAHIPLFAFSVFVLLFCLGPRDLGEEVNDYRQAIADNDEAEVQSLATELLEYATEMSPDAPDIERAIYAQANNRIFGVVFWFGVLGPVGAWLFRVLDLMRKRAIQQQRNAAGGNDSTEMLSVVQVVVQLHRLLAWIPSRLLMVGYTLAGSYDGAVAAWRQPLPERKALFPGEDDYLLGAVGCGAAPENDSDSVSERAQVAIDLVVRTLWMIWCPVLALLTLYGVIN